jgi:hypothetical protein
MKAAMEVVTRAAELFQLRPGEILDGEVDHQATQPQKPVREPPGPLRCWRLVIDALVPKLQGGGDADRPKEHQGGANDAQIRHGVAARGHQLVDVLGRLLIETEAGDEGVPCVATTLGGNEEHEGEQAQHREHGELHGAVHEVDGVEPGPEGSRRGGLHPLDCVGLHIEQPSLLIQQPSLLIAERVPLRSACSRGVCVSETPA